MMESLKVSYRFVIIFCLLAIAMGMSFVFTSCKKNVEKENSKNELSSIGADKILDDQRDNPGDIKMNSYFANHMMFQQQKPVVIWGKDAPNGQVTVKLVRDKDGKIAAESTCKAVDGNFIISLDAQKASYDTYTLIIEGSGTKKFTDILIGELWVCGGQSNMEMPVKHMLGGQEEVGKANNKNIRLFVEERLKSTTAPVPYEPQFDTGDAKWSVGDNPAAVGEVTAVGYTFALNIFKALNQNGEEVPVGIIDTALGGTFIDAWLPREAIENNDRIKQTLKKSNRYRLKEEFNKDGQSNYTQMTSCYNQRVAPLANTNIRGILWYQGEGNVGDYNSAQYYREALGILMGEWSRCFGSPDKNLPFIFSHIAPYDYNQPENMAYSLEGLSDAWSDHKDHSVQVPIYDLQLTWNEKTYPNKHPIHPLEKRPIGERMALGAMAVAYGAKGEYMAPVYDTFRIENDKILVTFQHVGEGLKIREGNIALNGFCIAGNDGKFLKARARILSKDTVEVWSEFIDAPKHVTYGFSNFNMASNLCNALGIPAVPFRTSREASHTYYYPKVWAECQEDQVWVFMNHGATPDAKFVPAWETGKLGAKGNIQVHADGLKTYKDRYAMEISYNAGEDGRIEFGSALGYKTLYHQFHEYGKMFFDIYNPDDVEKTFEGIGILYEGKVYTLPSDQTRIQPKKWYTICVDLNALVDSTGAQPADKEGVLLFMEAFQFKFRHAGQGKLFISDIRFAYK